MFLVGQGMPLDEIIFKNLGVDFSVFKRIFLETSEGE